MKAHVVMVFLTFSLFSIAAEPIRHPNQKAFRPTLSKPTYWRARTTTEKEMYYWTQKERRLCVELQQAKDAKGYPLVDKNNEPILEEIRIYRWLPKTYYNIHWCKKRENWVCNQRGCLYVWDQWKKRFFHLPEASGEQSSRSGGHYYVPQGAYQKQTPELLPYPRVVR